MTNILNNFFQNPILFVITSFVVSYLSCIPLLIFLKKFRILDRPNERSSHKAPTARGGGLSILFVLIIWTTVFFLNGIKGNHIFLCLILFVVALVSLIDDIRGLSSLLRLIIHFTGAFFFIFFYKLYDISDHTISIFEHQYFMFIIRFCIWLILLIFLVGYTNAFNFMDGINGIAGFQAAISANAMGYIAQHFGNEVSLPIIFCYVLGGSSLGFLPYNFPKARIFLGDVGSAPIGLLLAFLICWIVSINGLQLLLPLLLLQTNFILDTGITLTRRFLKGDVIWSPHREHFYQRLIRSGKSHTFVTAITSSLTLLTCLLSFLIVDKGIALQLLMTIIILVIWISFFCYCERQFKKHVHL